MDLDQLPNYQYKEILCRDCGKPIRFIKNQKSNAKMPVDDNPIKVVTSDGRVVQAYLPHWDTCPNLPDKGNQLTPSRD